MSKKLGIAVGISVAVIVIVVLGALFMSHQTSLTPPQANPLAKTHRETIVKGVITISPVSYKAFPLYVPSGATNARVEGSFTASGGLKNDIRVYIMDETAFINWKNGHQVSVYYDSGQLTTTNFNVPLPPGKTYYLVLDNTFSLISSKNVNIVATLIYKS